MKKWKALPAVATLLLAGIFVGLRAKPFVSGVEWCYCVHSWARTLSSSDKLIEVYPEFQKPLKSWVLTLLMFTKSLYRWGKSLGLSCHFWSLDPKNSNEVFCLNPRGNMITNGMLLNGCWICQESAMYVGKKTAKSMKRASLGLGGLLFSLMLVWRD